MSSLHSRSVNKRWLNKIQKQINTTVKYCGFVAESCVAFTSRWLSPATKTTFPSLRNYQFVCHCDSRYVGRTFKRLQERIKQNISKFLANLSAFEAATAFLVSAKLTLAGDIVFFTSLPLPASSAMIA